MRMSDVIEDFIKDLFEEDESDYVEIQRNELAQHFNCVPSQINYVISTRFKPSQGYYVESKRGGGGNIKIKKINNTKSDYIMHIINNIGTDNLDFQNIINQDGKIKDYSLILKNNNTPYNLNFFIDDFYYNKETSEEFKNYRNTVLKIILNA